MHISLMSRGVYVRGAKVEGQMSGYLHNTAILKYLLVLFYFQYLVLKC